MNGQIKGVGFFGLILVLFCSAFSQMPRPQSQSDQNLLGVKSDPRASVFLIPANSGCPIVIAFLIFQAGTSGSFGVYSNLMEYRFSKPLTLTLSLNYLHQPLSVFHTDQLRIKDAILPNFQLRYRPNDSFYFTINVLTFPHPYYRQGPDPWFR